jgi:hypothetical protein
MPGNSFRAAPGMVAAVARPARISGVGVAVEDEGDVERGEGRSLVTAGEDCSALPGASGGIESAARVHEFTDPT